MVDTVVEAVDGQVPVMVHVGAAATRWSVELARHAEQAGADAISALPPIGRPYSPDQVWAYFKDIASSVDLPLYLYHLPQIYGDLITMDKFAAAVEEMPTLAGAKFSSYRIDDLIKLRLAVGDRLNILSGCGEQLLSAIACGADGSICTWYNFLARLGAKIIECVKAGELEEARKHEELIVAFAGPCISKGYAWVKRLVSDRGIPSGHPRPPLPSLTEEEYAAGMKKLEAIGVLEWGLRVE